MVSYTQNELVSVTEMSKQSGLKDSSFIKFNKSFLIFGNLFLSFFTSFSNLGIVFIL